MEWFNGIIPASDLLGTYENESLASLSQPFRFLLMHNMLVSPILNLIEREGQESEGRQ